MASNNRVSSGHKNINYAADRWQFPATVMQSSGRDGLGPFSEENCGFYL
jgi:hypothetical protein